MSKQAALDQIRRSRLVPVVRAPAADTALRVVDALVEGGLDVMEVTMTVPGAVGVLSDLAKRYPSGVLIGAGTVLDVATAEACFQAGAKFVVSPHFDRVLLEACQELGIVVAAGALTPTEILAAWRAGSDVVKIFPCDSMGGPGYIKSIKAPFPQIPLMSTGGIRLDNVRAFLEAGADAVGVGSTLVDLKLLESNRSAFVELARQYVEKVRGFGS